METAYDNLITHTLICSVRTKPTFAVLLPESSNLAFQVKDGTGTTVNPEETKIPIHSPYPNPPLHQPLNAKDGENIRFELKSYFDTYFSKC